MESTVVYPNYEVYQQSKVQLSTLEQRIKNGEVGQFNALVDAYLMGMEAAQKIYVGSPLQREA